MKPQPDPEGGPVLFTTGCPIVDTQPHCYWVWGDNAGLDANAEGCRWVWHHGPTVELAASSDPRVILLPKGDLFSIRGVDIENTPDGFAAYRTRIDVPWSEKRDLIYFRGYPSGRQDPTNARLLACRLLKAAEMPADVGVAAGTPPEDFVPRDFVKELEPLHYMAQYKFVLSLWGNHPFNPRLYRGLEGGSLVFHQATPTIRHLDDGLLTPGRHYVEIAADLSDLVEKVDYFFAHPAEARQIADEGHQAWMEQLFVSEPFALPDVMWERFVSQANWQDFCDAFDMA